MSEYEYDIRQPPRCITHLSTPPEPPKPPHTRVCHLSFSTEMASANVTCDADLSDIGPAAELFNEKCVTATCSAKEISNFMSEFVEVCMMWSHPSHSSLTASPLRPTPSPPSYPHHTLPSQPLRIERIFEAMIVSEEAVTDATFASHWAPPLTHLIPPLAVHCSGDCRTSTGRNTGHVKVVHSYARDTRSDHY